MPAREIERLRPLAAKYIWWKTADEALLSQAVSEEEICGVLREQRQDLAPGIIVLRRCLAS